MSDRTVNNTDEFDDETFESFLDAVPEHTPPPEIKNQLLAKLGHSNAETTNVVPLQARTQPAQTVQNRGRTASETSRKPWAVLAGAAAAALLVGITVLTPVLNNTADDAGEGAIVAEETQSTRGVPSTAGHEQMHEIMSAADMVSGATTAEGARLKIVSSNEMGKAGAMVDGQPELADGMGAQVWAVDKHGVVRSAGVIGQDPHQDVWMPFDAAAHKVMITEEPAAGSASPSGRMLAEVELEA
ncbi:anti-sigma factor [Corynebacterium pseudodiphtheriticum]|uniref:Anti-sigma factor n=1 Tax=Corynebacterium pseudodiphtheriticum TaxID=37637 RepID=A0AAP4BPE4_9CORY|nr:anti-sigma factor [Corynebacterium pseudodiphtheriticum]MDK4228551.1 anti-sigma factor [Corynebacterium pseudodiphtheriticum]MDK4290252.1 anti-sigma factor [Corynebacterium pseudodiphtheriticum]MDK4306577.1 anti-sigma factor [Corynebacterium pseudodiphtheriticum]MDK4327863.1 anti-sigma factor [Corynebacterium pseudodiphtheriticum]